MEEQSIHQGFLDPRPPEVRPGSWLYFLALTILIVGVAFGMFRCGGAVATMMEDVQSFQAPGSRTITLTEGDIFTVGHRLAHPGQVSPGEAAQYPQGVRISVINSETGESAPLIGEGAPTPNRPQDSPGMVFEIQQSGPHLVTVSYVNGETAPALVCDAIAFDPNEVFRDVLIGLGVTLLAVIVALLMFIVTLISRSRSKRRIAAADSPG